MIGLALALLLVLITERLWAIKKLQSAQLDALIAILEAMPESDTDISQLRNP